MSSRARRVEEPASPYDWRAVSAPPRSVVQASEPTAAAEEPQAAAADLLTEPPRLAEIERDAFVKGYAQGERAGAEAAGTRADAMLRRLAATIEELASTRNDMIRRTERQVVELALAVARQILQRELDVDRGLLLAMARVALDRLGEHVAATIRLHPDDYAIVMASSERGSTRDQVEVVADAGVGRGGCLVQSDFGLMDAGLDSQFSELAHTLLGGPTGDPSADPARERYGVTVPA